MIPYLIPAAAALLGALITGILGVALKRRWDRQDEQLRWYRDRQSRQIEAYVAYLAQRPTLAAISAHLQAHANRYDSVPELYRTFEVASVRLQLLLDDESQREVVREDMADVWAWFEEAGSRADWAERDVSSPLAVIALALQGGVTPGAAESRARLLT